LPLFSQARLKFCEDAQHVQKRLARCGCGVNRLICGFKRNGFALERSNNILKVRHRPSQPVNSGHDERVARPKIVPGFGYMPFVFLTARTDRKKKLKARGLGTDDDVTKLVDFDVLIAIINARRARAVNERAPRDVTRVKPVKLNERELETLTWAARGKTSAQIAQILSLT